MNFLWPEMLWLLLGLPMLVLLYLWLLKKKRQTTVRLASVNIAMLRVSERAPCSAPLDRRALPARDQIVEPPCPREHDIGDPGSVVIRQHRYRGLGKERPTIQFAGHDMYRAPMSGYAGFERTRVGTNSGKFRQQ